MMNDEWSLETIQQDIFGQLFRRSNDHLQCFDDFQTFKKTAYFFTKDRQRAFDSWIAGV